MKTKMIIAALAIAVGTMGVSPTEVDAKPKKLKKAIKKAHKQSHKKQKQHYKRHNNDDKRHHNHGGHGRVKIKYDYPDYDRESYGIYTTPRGGLGFYYSESEGPSYGYPYGYGGGYRYF